MDGDVTEPIFLLPPWRDAIRCSDGSRGIDETRGGGETSSGGEAEARQAKESGHGGNLGLFTANWDGHWTEPKLQHHMLRDAKSSPCQLLCLREVEDDLMIHLRTPVDGDASAVAEGRPGSKFIGVRGSEPRPSLAICARQSVCPGIRLLVFHRTCDWPYKVKKRIKYAVSRIMIASVKMRYFKIRGGGEDEDDAEGIDEINICNAHLHFRTAKKGLHKGSMAFKDFWDLLARYLAIFGPRYLCGDFNMALFCVVPELRARGFQINLAAWYCWQNHIERIVRADSCAISVLALARGLGCVSMHLRLASDPPSCRPVAPW